MIFVRCSLVIRRSFCSAKRSFLVSTDVVEDVFLAVTLALRWGENMGFVQVKIPDSCDAERDSAGECWG